MAKILVADDNSNIQKMVGLALKDQGIDVVAVGNGEAAVRKISDIKPDLVLADVFMPVRNGYEVCQYVKGDAALAHIPVILLVGAFDPLDEQEAQRVGADGVLKKPFVPPDPLISMVKSALARAGVSLGNEPVVVVPVKEEVPAFRPLAFQTAPPSPVPAFEEPAIEDIPARPTPIRNAYSVAEETPAELVTAEAATEDLPSAYTAEATWSVAVGKTEEPEVQHATVPQIEAPVPSPAAIAMPDLISVREAAPEPEVVPEPIPATIAAANNSWMSVPPSPWDAEVAKASKLAATWGTSAAVATVASATVPQVHQPAPSSEPEPVAKIEDDKIPTYVPAATEEVIREEAAQVVEESAPEVSHLPSVTEAAVIAAPSVDDMVARVLAKMDPSVLQAMTRELLKPVIESIVRQELNKK